MNLNKHPEPHYKYIGITLFFNMYHTLVVHHTANTFDLLQVHPEFPSIKGIMVRSAG